MSIVRYYFYSAYLSKRIKYLIVPVSDTTVLEIQDYLSVDYNIVDPTNAPMYAFYYYNNAYYGVISKKLSEIEAIMVCLSSKQGKLMFQHVKKFPHQTAVLPLLPLTTIRIRTANTDKAIRYIDNVRLLSNCLDEYSNSNDGSPCPEIGSDQREIDKKADKEWSNRSHEYQGYDPHIARYGYNR